MALSIYSSLQQDSRASRKKFAVLIDSDKYTPDSLKRVAELAVKAGASYFLFGGSLLTTDSQGEFIAWIKEHTDIPVILFPGNSMQLNNAADGILLLSLISGRNPELLIGRHVLSAPFLKASNLEIIPTGYMLIESGRMTSVAYMSGTTPIPSDKEEIAVCTAMAGEMLGLRMIYLDAGSGAQRPVPASMIRQVKQHIDVPLVIGGGITTAAQAKEALDAGADLIVIGNAIEKDPAVILQIAGAVNR